MKQFLMNLLNRKVLIFFILLLVWVVLHLPVVKYGTENLAIHMSYVGDEQAPINGALHILQEKNLLALRNLKTVYYGPVFSMVAVPAVLVDFVEKQLLGVTASADSYKNFILWDWGGIVQKARLISLMLTFFGLLFFYKALSSRLLNASGNSTLPIIATLLLSSNFYFFEYSSFFKHWAFVLTYLCILFYVFVRVSEFGFTRKYILIGVLSTTLAFGVSYLSIFFNIIWLPSLWLWLKQRDKTKLALLIIYAVLSIIGCFVMVAWHPYAFFRIIGLAGGDLANETVPHLTTDPNGHSFLYYGGIAIRNHLPLVILLLTLLFYWLKKRFELSRPILFGAITVGLGYYLLFGSLTHQESRYVLPIIFFLITSTSILGISYWNSSNRKRSLDIVCITLVVAYLLFHVASIVRWSWSISNGPTEVAAIHELQRLQSLHPSAKIVALQSYLFGTLHTRDAYKEYAASFGKADLNLYKTILVTNPPVGRLALNVYYQRPQSPRLIDLRGADILMYQYRFYDFEKEPDFVETDLTRLWFYEDFTDRYFLVKVPK